MEIHEQEQMSIMFFLNIGKDIATIKCFTGTKLHLYAFSFYVLL